MMRSISDNITGTSPTMIAIMVGTSILAIVGIAIGLYSEAPNEFAWNAMSQDYKILLGVFFFILLIMTGLSWMMLNLSISIKADKDLIKARIFPFMRSYRDVRLSDVLKMKVIDFSGGLMKYGGVGYKRRYGRRTSYTVHLEGHALVIYLMGQKELHIEISKIAEWKAFVESFQKENV